MKKGFTLVELLAVIAILAIIAVIITPTVLESVRNSRGTVNIISAQKYIDAVEQAVLEKNLDEKFKPDRCTINSDGNLTCDDVILELNAEGKMPTGGVVKFYSREVNYALLEFGDKKFTLNSKGELVEGETVCTLIDGEANIMGSKYQCKVKDDMEEGFEDGYYFFLLSHNEDGTMNLIMDRNIYYDNTNNVGKVVTETNKGLVAWYSSEANNSYGPVTALTYLHNATKDWNNIPNMIMNYEDENINFDTQEKGTIGYGSIKTTGNITKITSKNGIETGRIENLKARMPRYNEIYGEGKCLKKFGSCPLWLSNYLSSSSYVTGNGLQNISGIYGYWLLSSNGTPSSLENEYVYAWHVLYHGTADFQEYYDGYGLTFDYVNDADNFGVRPVITLKL